jgi:hypothetical protein
VCPVSESERMLQDLNCPKTYRLFKDGNHVCDNLTHVVRPLMADWMMNHLSK